MLARSTPGIVFPKVTLDGGRTCETVGNHKLRVDDHALWIDPDDTGHFLI
jgi:hypothetical protein